MNEDDVHYYFHFTDVELGKERLSNLCYLVADLVGKGVSLGEGSW